MMPRHRFSIAVLLFASAAVTVAHPAVAQSNEATATELFDAGRDLLKAGNYAAACPKLAASLKLDAKVGTLARLAECEEHVGQLANAHGHWARARSLAESAHDPRLEQVKAAFLRVDQLVPKLDVELTGAPPPGVALRIDGLDVGASFGIQLPVERGPHTIEVRADGKKPWSSPVDASQAGAVVRLTVPPLEDAPLPPPVVAPVAAPDTPTALVRPYRVPGLVVGGVGVAGVAAGILVGVLVAKHDANTSNGEGCSGSVCTTTQGQSERASAVTAGNVATGVFVAGAVLTGVGVTLALLPAKRVPVSSASLSAKVGLGSLSVVGEF